MNPAIKDAFEREFPVPDCLYFNEVEGDYWVREDRNRNEPSAEIGSRYNGRWATWQKCWDAGAVERRNSERFVWCLPILTGSDDDEADRRTLQVGLSLARGLDGAEAIDAAMNHCNAALAAAKDAT